MNLGLTKKPAKVWVWALPVGPLFLRPEIPMEGLTNHQSTGILWQSLKIDLLVLNHSRTIEDLHLWRIFNPILSAMFDCGEGKGIRDVPILDFQSCMKSFGPKGHLTVTKPPTFLHKWMCMMVRKGHHPLLVAFPLSIKRGNRTSLNYMEAFAGKSATNGGFYIACFIAGAYFLIAK